MTEEDSGVSGRSRVAVNDERYSDRVARLCFGLLIFRCWTGDVIPEFDVRTDIETETARPAGGDLMKTLLVLRSIVCLSFVFGIGCGETEENLASLPYYNDATLTPLWVSADSVDQLVPHRIGAFSLTDQGNALITQEGMEGKITVVDFFFTSCPALCPKLTRSMVRIQDSVRGEPGVQLLSLSVTPEQDSVPVLKAYAEANDIDGAQWHLLTGSHRAIYSAAREHYFADVDTGTSAFLHTETFYLVDGERRIRGVYNGTLATDVVQLVEDIRTLQKAQS